MGATGLRAITEHGDAALVLRPADAAMPLMSQAANAVGRPDAGPPVQQTVQCTASFRSGHRRLPPGVHHRRAARKVP